MVMWSLRPLPKPCTSSYDFGNQEARKEESDARERPMACEPGVVLWITWTSKVPQTMAFISKQGGPKAILLGILEVQAYMKLGRGSGFILVLVSGIFRRCGSLVEGRAVVGYRVRGVRDVLWKHFLFGMLSDLME